MQNLRRMCWLFWVGLPMLAAYPVPSPLVADSSQTSWQWERYWMRYAIALSSVTATALTLAGCLCCQRHRRPKGFQDKAEKYNQEFKDGSSTGQENAFDHSVEGLELDASRTLAASERVQFEPLPVDSIVSGTRSVPKHKAIPLSAPRIEDQDTDYSILQEPCSEWFNSNELYVPREKLKYLREIGHGWFGKVVEGRADLEQSKGISKSGGVVVRILTEEATTREKAWFLGEATPYLKLRHQNVLALLGFCLETDPYLLLFESCPAGDLKGFLLSNRDSKSREALAKENVPIRIAIDIASGLKHMHNHGFAHTDLSARNCLIAPDLSAKLGDYGTGVEKYPEDYYIVGDRALPIRWSAPESLNCTDTTIETQEITLQANMWSYAVLLWEIASWGERPYNDMNDEQVIQMILSLKNQFVPNGTKLLQNYLTNCPPNIFQMIRLCLNVNARDRPSLDDVKLILLNEQSAHIDFEQRWESLRANTCKQHVRSASLQDLRGSIDSDYWTHIVDDAQTTDSLQSSFRLGPDEQVRNIPKIKTATVFQESGSETEEESWKGRIEQGVYTEKVKQKSKSVTDLMVLVHIDPDSDAEWSMGAQTSEKNVKKKLPVTGSDSDLRHTVPADEFDEALKKLRDPLPSNATNKVWSIENIQQPKVLTLITDQNQMPILRLSLDNTRKTPEDNNSAQSNVNVSNKQRDSEKHILRLLSNGNSNVPLLRYVPDQMFSDEEVEQKEDHEMRDISLVNKGDSDRIPNVKDAETNTVDVLLWNHALDSALQHKVPGFSDEAEFNEYIDASTEQNNTSAPELTTSTPDAPQFCNTYSIYTTDDSFSIVENAERKPLPNDDEEERKQLSTPDDEQSSDSGFRDKESCEEEEAVCSSGNPLSSINSTAVSRSSYSEEEPFQILFELDTILDAEYYATSAGPDSITEGVISTSDIEKNMLPSKQSTFDLNHISVKVDVTNSDSTHLNDTKQSSNRVKYESTVEDIETENKDITPEKMQVFTANSDIHQSHYSEVETRALKLDALNTQRDECSLGDYENEDEDSSTVSLRSDNSYVSFSMEEEFVTAIRNELREKLPQAQMQIVESLEAHDDENSSISDDAYGKQWDDEDGEDLANQVSGGVDISIRYNVYGTPLSPILEERESTVTSESLVSNSRETSVASRESVPSEDMLLVDTRTNEMILLEGRLQDDDRDTTNGDLSEEENLDYTCSVTRPLEDKSHIVKTSGGAPLPSPEEESKWQQLPSSFPLPLPLPLPLQDDLMSTSFVTERECCSQDEDEEEEEEEMEEEEDEDGEEDEDNSSSSGEFVWKRYNELHIEQIRIKSTVNNDKTNTATSAELEELAVEDEEEEEEFTPSAWNAALAPHRSALRSPDKTLKSGDQKKSVWFKKQRYQCVYEYPKETLPADSQADTITNSEPTSYSDWEEMMNEPRLDLYPLDYDDANHVGNEEFFVSSSNRPFQFQTGESKYVSQFFPGANAASFSDDQDETDSCRQELHQNNVDFAHEYDQCQQHQLGELRHTRDRLKLNLVSSNGIPSAPFVPARQSLEDEQIDIKENHEPELLEKVVTQDQYIVSSSINDTLPKVPHEDVQVGSSSTRISQCDSQETLEPTEKCSVLARD
ncbi:Serine/threonine-protein kinase LMTK1 [Trachymyrmex zeteki]|uniref:Serine/threonine-protein kinase LMTK1 n=1 Tax=Mycetomoellerius zeteki TaxID=64791 RepID=A0A151X6K4_9HYME|nr:PREDICTED: STE20-like serine/threonine-protein kinase isoform X1 [Trachymyrmex zeteki]KYQ56033.1 Serine/threonine-protein kinase LMTK1 [Trachymyrmex zeteki]